MPLVVPHATGRYTVAADALDRLGAYLPDTGIAPGPCLVVTDETVQRLHGDRLLGVLDVLGFAPRVLAVPPGESAKSLAQLGALYDAALSSDGPKVNRQTAVFAFGGGVMGDLGGFFAATLLRGLPLVQLPTTLLAQVDSSLGGKTGINHATGKNLIGAFYPPRLVLADPAVLQTLPPRELASGLAEAVKHALIADATLATFFEEHLGNALAGDPAVLAETVARAQRIKAEVVIEDEFETGRRAHLNFGHTFAHALERATGFNPAVLTHGEAVAVGMRCALRLSKALAPHLDAERLDALVARLPVPPLPPLDVDDLMTAMQGDKKRGAEGLRFVVLEDVGRAAVVQGVPDALVRDAWTAALG
ncbi:MAG: 3-dehydroquinate synthase [Bacteroidetes bacterium]|nr:3-dehydroquinate synthase [Bacteroidota bacterium]